TLVYRADKKVWEDLDTTPASAERTAQVHASIWESVSDFFSNLKYQFARWRWSKTHYTSYLKWVLVPLILFLAWRILFNQRQRRIEMEGSPMARPWPGLDSEFYLLQKKIADAGWERHANESLEHWQERAGFSPDRRQRLNQLLNLHKRLRFDPLGLRERDRQELRNETQQWLADFDLIFPLRTEKSAEVVSKINI
ncbi:MAG: hypothetical protein ABJC04_04070, partial [Verrucomicrobiota bacterium]